VVMSVLTLFYAGGKTATTEVTEDTEKGISWFL
jgi:hypothetical protein